jgi:phosphatidylinositol-3-phosphatase
MPAPTVASTGPFGVRCDECASPMAPDQRYCCECGARRGPLPRHIAHTLGAVLEQGAVLRPQGDPESEATEGAAVGATAVAGDGAGANGDENEAGEASDGTDPPATAGGDSSSNGGRGAWRTPIGAGLPTPGAAALAVMGMLAFGVVVGALARGGVAALASLPQIVLNIPGGGSSSQDTGGSSAGPASPQAAPSSTGGGSASGGDQTQGVRSGGGGTVGSPSGAGNALTPAGNGGLPPVGHLFLIVLSQQGYAQTFGPGSTDTYLSRTLTAEGKLLVDYYAVAASPLANRIALVSGQGPTQQTAASCPLYGPITSTGVGADGQVLGDGCVYPTTTNTLAGQLAAEGRTWRAYTEGIGTGQAAPCNHPASGSANTSSPTPQQPYAVWTNPFMFFGSLVNSPSCAKDNVGLDQLKTDLVKKATTPTLSYITPSPCDDGNDQPCAPGAPAGLAQADRFLQSVLPEIESSPAYKADGLIAITFDQAPQTGPHADPSSCCGNPTYPNAPLPTTPAPTPPTTTTPTTTTPTTTATTPTTTPTAPTTPAGTSPNLGSGESSPTGGGGQVGLLLISRYVKKGTDDTLDYFNHFSLLGSIEQLLKLKQLGYAHDIALPKFTPSVFSPG